MTRPPDAVRARGRGASIGAEARIPRLFAAEEHRPFAFGDAGRVGALLLHGFAGTPAEMRPLGQALAEVGIDAYGPLLPGFGAQIHRLGDVDGDDWLAAAADAWAEVRRAYPTTVLVGFSMGGALALQLAARWAPERLVLLAPLWRLLGPAWPAGALLPLAGRVMPTFSPFRGADFHHPEVRGFFARAAADLDLDDPVVQRAVRTHARVPTRSFAHLWRVALQGGRAARRVAVPTLVIQGRADRAVFVRDTRALVRRLAGPVDLREVAWGHQIVDPRAAVWPEVRDGVVDFARPATSEPEAAIRA
jgi:carboxylesterase